MVFSEPGGGRRKLGETGTMQCPIKDRFFRGRMNGNDSKGRLGGKE